LPSQFSLLIVTTEISEAALDEYYCFDLGIPFDFLEGEQQVLIDVVIAVEDWLDKTTLTIVLLTNTTSLSSPNSKYFVNGLFAPAFLKISIFSITSSPSLTLKTLTPTSECICYLKHHILQ
jgi:hypothetical protein